MMITQMTIFLMIATQVLLMVGWLFMIFSIRNLSKISRANTNAIILLLSIYQFGSVSK